MRKVTIRTILILAALMVSVGVYAQPENPPFSQDPGSGGSGGGGSCYVCSQHQNDGVTPWVSCFDINYTPLARVPYPSAGNSRCVEHNVPIGSYGPAYCEMSVPCVGGMISDARGHSGNSVEDQVAGIETFLRQSGAISAANLNDFIAVTDYSLRGEPYTVASQKRLAAYREEFNRLVARGDPRRELKPGAIPVIPHKPEKAPATVTASR